MRIVFRQDKCAGCNICSIACMDQNDYDPAKGCEPFRTVRSSEKNGVQRFVSLACVHCGQCIDICPFECIKRDADTGFVVADNTDCIGCGACAVVCPIDAPKICGGKMTKCDGCSERVKAGLLPACVRACPTGALALE